MLIDVPEELVEDYVNDYISELTVADLLDMFPDVRTRIYDLVADDARDLISEDIFYRNLLDSFKY